MTPAALNGISKGREMLVQAEALLHGAMLEYHPASCAGHESVSVNPVS